MKTVTEIIRFYLVGLLNTAFGYLAFALLIFIGLTYAYAALIATSMGVIFNYFTTGNLVFKRKKASLLKFALFYAAIYLLNITICAILKKITALNDYYLGFIITCFLSIISYLANKFFVFTRTTHENT